MRTHPQTHEGTRHPRAESFRMISSWWRSGVRVVAAVSALGLMLGLAPGSAENVLPAAHAGSTIEQQIMLATFGSPAVPRLVYSTAGNNGIFGFVFEVAAAARSFTLIPADSPTGLEDFDIAFYSGLDATEPIASFGSSGNEAGTIPAGSAWAVVTMSAGAGGTFRYVWS